jgi:hypothetical protein
METQKPFSYKPETEETSEQQFDRLVGNMRYSIQQRSISFIDSDGADLYNFLLKHRELSGSDLEHQARLEALEAIVAGAWQSPGWEKAIERLSNPRLENSDNTTP